MNIDNHTGDHGGFTGVWSPHCSQCGQVMTPPHYSDRNLEGYWERAYWRVVPKLQALLVDIERLRRIEHAARDVDGLWSEGRTLLHWEQEAGEALSDLRTALILPTLEEYEGIAWDSASLSADEAMGPFEIKIVPEGVVANWRKLTKEQLIGELMGYHEAVASQHP